MREVIITLRAQRQLTSAANWWLSHRDKAPEAFDADVSAALETIAEHPLVGEVISQRPGVRRVHLRRIRYVLFYRIAPSGNVYVLSLWHASRGSGPRL
jgi:plasmid stabilization system protein ParE